MAVMSYNRIIFSTEFTKKTQSCTEKNELRHCEGDSPKQYRRKSEQTGLLRYARNDGNGKNHSNHSNQINHSSDNEKF